ncbi:hypothetical protein LTT61_13890 [Nocardia asteroides]|nr:hypothetical protein [Nocardia asteroides]UGT64305.1 hypothetical protein LTT61_13890 [Nocardia asteroides]
MEAAGFTASRTRSELFGGLIRYLVNWEEVSAKLGFSAPLLRSFWIAGSFASSKVDPCDLDISPVIDGVLADRARGRPGSKMIAKLTQHRDGIKSEYGLEVFPPSLVPCGASASSGRRPGWRPAGVPARSGAARRLVGTLSNRGFRPTLGGELCQSTRLPGGSAVSIRDQFSEFLDGFEPDPDIDEVDDAPASSFLRAAMLDGLRQFDSAASLPGFASIRLVGERFDKGVFDAAAAEIFGLIDREVRAAVPADIAEGLSIGFREVRDGSVVLPLLPFGADTPADGEIEVSGPSPLETALERVIELHDVIERGEQVGPDFSSGLWHRLRLLVDSLDKADAGVEIDLSGHDGRRQVSRLTERGRVNARRLLEPVPQVELSVKAGFLSAVGLQDEFARIQLLHNRRKTEIERIPASIAKALPWDSFLRIQVRTETSADRFGERRRTEHQFIRLMEQEDPIPELDGGM